MIADKYKNVIQNLLSPCGITINGAQPWDIQVTNEKFYQRILSDGSLGLGESYMDGWWDCGSLDDLFCRLIPSRLEDKIKTNWKMVLHSLSARVINKSRKSRAFQIGKKHYDIGNDLFRNMLDRRMTYSCAYWKKCENLDEAQEAKLELICRKLAIHPGDRVLDIGCGWGGFARYAAEKYGADVTGITVSREQANFAREVCKGLPVDIRLQDYRDIDDKFDHVVSVGMFEHVGYKNYRRFMDVAHRCLQGDGLFLLHTIGRNETTVVNDSWIEKYIFPNSMIPSMKQISDSIEKIFVMEDWHNIGVDYYSTLRAWYENFEKSWGVLQERYGERFYRMWKYYLLSCAAAFKTRHLHVWQIVLHKTGIQAAYHRVN